MNWIEFQQQWGERFDRVKLILDYLNTYPETHLKALNIDLASSEMLDENQKDWLWLLDKFDNPIEKEFFKPCWVPLGREGFEPYIDLSSAQYSIFNGEYFSELQWYTSFLVRDIYDLMIAMDSIVDLDNIRLRQSSENDKIINELFDYPF